MQGLSYSSKIQGLDNQKIGPLEVMVNCFRKSQVLQKAAISTLTKQIPVP